MKLWFELKNLIGFLLLQVMFHLMVSTNHFFIRNPDKSQNKKGDR